MNIRCYCSLIITMLLCVAGMQAQSITNYAFTASTGTYTVMTGGTQLHGASADDNVSSLTVIGFPFLYMGQYYSHFAASSNGNIQLFTSSSGTGSTSAANNLTSGPSATTRPVLAPLWDDIKTGTAGSVKYLMTGNSPNRILTVQFDQMLWNYNGTSPAISFQVKLYEANGVVEFYYQQEAGAINNASSGASIGISGVTTGSGTFLSVNSTFNAVSSTTETTSIATKPATGTILSFTPPQGAVTAPTNLTFTSIQQTSMTLNWTDNSSNETGFVIQRSTDNTTFTSVGTVTVNTTTYTATGLTASTLYYWKVFAVTEGIASTSLNGSQATANPTPLTPGVYPINGTQNPPTSFSNIANAVTHLINNGVTGTGDIIFEFNTGYTSTSDPSSITIPAITGAAATRRIIFRPATGFSAVTTIAGTSTATFAIQLLNANYVTLDGRAGGTGTTNNWTITCTGSGTSGNGQVAVACSSATTSTSVIVRNCNLKAEAANTTNGIVNVVGSGPFATLQILNNTIQSTGTSTTTCRGYGINFTASSSSNTGIEFSGNNIIDVYARGITFGGAAPNGKVYQNKVYHTAAITQPTTTEYSSLYFFTTTSAGLEIYGNQIYNIQLQNGTTAINGIYLFNANTTGSEIRVYNNMVELGRALNNAFGTALSSGINGIRDQSVSGGLIGVYNNSVYIGGTVTATVTTNSAAFRKQSSTVMNVRNNIFVNARSNSSSSSTHWAIMSNNTSYSSISNNDYFVTGTGGILGTTDGTTTGNKTTLTAWQTALTADQNSFSANPLYLDPAPASFTSVPNLKISTTTPTLAESGGATISGITTDFEGDIRFGNTGYSGTGNAVDVGADEFEGADGKPPVITYTSIANTTQTSNRTLASFATITDQTGVNVTSGTRPRIYYRKTTNANTFNDNTSATDGWKWVEATNTSSPFSFVINYSLLQGGSVSTGDVLEYFVIAQDVTSTIYVGANQASFTTAPTSVNLVAANFPVTTARSYSIVQAISGTINVGPSETITSLTNTSGLFEIINSRVVTGNVLVQLTGSMLSETGTVALNQTSEEGTGGYTITIRPAAGTTDTISGTVANGLVRLNGADRIIIDGRRVGETTGRNLTIINTNTGTSSAVMLVNPSTGSLGCVYDTIRYCNIRTGVAPSTTATSVVSAGIHVGGSTHFADAVGHRGISIANNSIVQASVGICVLGSTTVLTDSIQINNNIVGSLLNEGTDNLHYSGIITRNVSVGTINGNTVQGILSSITSNTLTSQGNNGIGISSGSRNLVIDNNLIRRIRYTGSSGYEAIGIEVGTGLSNANLRVSNNVITGLSNDGWGSVADGINGIRLGYSISTNGSVSLIHNTIFLTDTMTLSTASTPYAVGIYVGSSCTGVDMRNNIVYNATLFAGTGAYKVYGIYSDATATAFTNANFNNYYVYAPTSTNAFFGYFGADRTDMASYRTASGLEGSSVAQYVGFIDTTRSGANFHLTQIQPSLKGTSAVSSTVSTDIDGLTRSSYIMGADEVKPVIQFTQQPSGTTICEGGNFSVTAAINTPITFDDGVTRTTPTPTYQWLLNGTPISGATNASYSVTGATTANAGSYALRVYASSIDSATSNAATVNVNTNASITAHPSGTSSNLCPGNTTFTLSVTATGTTPTYQWQKLVGATWTNISGATASTYRPLAGWATADSGSYRVVVSSTSPCSQSNNSNSAVVGVFTAASIATQPTVTPSNSRCLGDAFTLSASGAGSGVQYQWRLNSTNITGATNSTYSVTSATLSDYGTYDIVVSNTCNSVTSNTIVISQTTPTSITTQPVASTTLCPGQTYNVSVVAAGATLTYQWQKLNGAVWSNISGATSTSFSIASVTATDAASYRVNVTGTCGTVTSGSAVLNVNVTTAITTQPTQPSAYCVGDNISISGLVAAGTNVTYQWQKLSGVTWNSISGATSSIYSQTNAQVTDSGSYRVVVSGTCGTVNSNTITIIVNSPITVTTHPAWNNPNKCTGESATISATIAGTVSTYQWQRFNGTTWVNISGASASSYTLNNIALADSGDYRLLLTGPCSSPTTTNSARLFVQQNVQITTNPQGSAVCAGNSISMSVTTIGTVVSYQWQQDQLRNGTWTNISGATNSSYSKSNVTVADSGNYRVSIIGTCSATPVVSTGASIVIQLPYSVISQPTWPSTPTNVGQVVSLTVGYTGTANFQWQRDQQRNNNWVNVGTNTATYSYTVNTVADSGNYRCIVTGPCTAGSVTTSTASVFTCQPPTFTSQPQQPGTLCPGGTLSLSVQVNTQGQTVTYQWQRDINRNGTWTNISGATNTSYVNNNLQTTDAGFYRMQLTSSCNAVPVNSNTVDVVLNQPITVTTQPTSQTVCVGASVSFTAAATGNNPTYQWFYNNAPISTGLNATAASATLQLTNVSAASAGSYKCFISGTCSPNGVFTNAATLTVNSTVTISQQPQNTTGCAGTPVTLSVAAQGTNVAYQWKFGATAISGATNATYSIASPTTANNGSYSVDITSTCGNTTSNSATLTIYIPAAFSTQPATQTVCQGTNVSLSIGINADASAPTYQWRKNGTDINVTLNPTALSTTLVLSNATPSDNATYTCMVKTACQPNGIVSNGATLTVNPATSIATQPTGSTVCEGTSATLNVVAQGTSLSYQWKKNGTDIFGATNSSYVIPSVVLSDAGNYTVVVNGTCAPLSVTSNTATLAVNQRVQITGAALQNQTVCQGANVQFVTSAIGTGVTYQWRKNGAAITANSTALTATLSLTNVTPTDNGTYDCIVTGICNPNGVATNSASLAVNLPVIIQTTPQNQSVCQGANVQFTTSATGSVLGYQWRYNGQPISGNATATTTTLVLNNVTAANNGTYDVIVNGVCNVPTSAPATLTVNQPIAITTQPIAQKGCIGSTITTFVTTSGNVLSYQWQKDGNDIPGMTTAVLTITNPTSASSGIYRCVVNGSSACGTPQIISNAVGVVIGTPVVITTQPQDKSVAYGSTVTVTVEASGAGFGQNDQLFYRWYKGTTQLNDDNRINGSTTGTLTIRGIQPSDVTADYTVVVLGSCGQATSRQFAIVVPSASINSQPQGSTICAGRPTVFSVSAVATVPNSTLSYQWYRGTTALTDGGTISGASTALLQISGVAATDSGDYTVQILVQPGGARVTSNVAHLTVGETPTITTQPASQEVCADSKVTLSVVAKGIGLTYKWLVAGSTTVLGTSPTLEIAQVQPSMAGSYTVEITNICGAVTSSAAVITVNTLPSITEQPQGATVTVGGSFTVRVVATGSAPITYQWRKGGTDIPNATNSTFTKANADKTDEAEYTCIVRNGCGEVTTAKANVLVSTVSVGDAEQFGYSIQSTEPNPVSDVATVRYTVAQSGVIKITLTDVNGRTIATLCNEMQEAGNHSVLLRSGDLDIASGTYQITLVTPQGYTTTKRIVIVK